MIIACRTIMKNYRNFVWCFMSYITNIMSSSSIFSSTGTLFYDLSFMILFIIIISSKFFFAYITNFWFFIRLILFISQWYHFFFVKYYYFCCMLFLILIKSFHTIFTYTPFRLIFC